MAELLAQSPWDLPKDYRHPGKIVAGFSCCRFTMA